MSAGTSTAAQLLREIRQAEGRKLHEHRPLYLLPPAGVVGQEGKRDA